MLQSTKEGQNVRIGITQLMTDSVVIIPCASLNNVITHLGRIKDDKLNHSILVALQFTPFLSVRKSLCFHLQTFKRCLEGQVPCTVVPIKFGRGLELASSKSAWNLEVAPLI
uniref:Uncharacterized protein n=1 Tax=Setaria italica TaxID=4555 RepID=K3XNE3_SETIT